MMQAFYWDAPKHEKKEGEWWNFVAERVEDLGKAGFDALWLPPVRKASSNLVEWATTRTTTSTWETSTRRAG